MKSGFGFGFPMVPFAGGRSGGVFNPAKLGGLEHWFDISDATTITKDGSDFTSLVNNKALGGAMSQAILINQAKYFSTGFGIKSKSFLRFDGVNDYMSFSGAALTASTQIIVYKTIGVPAVGDTIISAANVVKHNKRSYINGAAQTNWDGGLAAGGSSNSIILSDETISTVMWRSGTDIKSSINNGAFTSGISGTTISTSDFNVGDWEAPTGARALNMDLAEILYYNRELSEAESLQVVEYLNSKYGIY